MGTSARDGDVVDGGARGGELCVDPGKAGSQLCCALEACDGAVEGATLVEEAGERIQRVNRVGIDRDCSQEGVDRRGRVPASPQGLPEVGVARRVAWREHGRALEGRDGVVDAPALDGEDAEKKDRLRMVGVAREHVSVEPLRLGELSRPMMLEASREEVHGLGSR